MNGVHKPLFVTFWGFDAKLRSVITADEPGLIAGKRALVVEDGPTLTHGGMEYGAGWFAAKQAGAAEIVDARANAVGTIKVRH